LKDVTGASPADREQLDFVACIHPVGDFYAATADTQMGCGKPRSSGRKTLSSIIRQDCANQVLDVLERVRRLF
jgi:hypothetical protein